MSDQTARGTLVYAGGFLGTLVIMLVYNAYSWIGLSPTANVRGASFLLTAILVALFNRWYWKKYDRTTQRRQLST